MEVRKVADDYLVRFEDIEHFDSFLVKASGASLGHESN